MVLKIIQSFLVLLILFSNLSFGQDFGLPKSGLKKLMAATKNAWPDKILKYSELDNGTALAKNYKLYAVKENDNLVGYITVSKAPSKFNYFDFAVLLSTDVKILGVKILVYREDRGGEIASPRWLKQFKGKTVTSKLELGHDIQLISGATLSCRAATKGVKQAVVGVNNWIKNK